MSDVDEDLLSPEEMMQELGERLIAGALEKSDEGRAHRTNLFGSANPKLFTDELHVIYKVLYRNRDNGVVPDEKFLNLVLTYNREIVESAKGYIDIASHGDVDGDQTAGYIAGVLKTFRRLKGMKASEDYKLDLMTYAELFKVNSATRVLYDSVQILDEGLKVGNKNISGFDGVRNFLTEKMSEIDGLVDKNSGAGFIYGEDLLNEEEATNAPYKICDFVDIPQLNKATGGVYTSNLISVMAPTKGGKSKFCARINHSAMLEGHNVTVWPHEGGYRAWDAQLRSIHFDHRYNTDTDHLDLKFGVDQGAIFYQRLSDENKQLEASSRLDLATNPEYGKVHYIDRPFHVETFLQEIDASVRMNNSSLIIIDYMQLIESANGRMDKRERIAKAYPLLLDYCKKNNVAIISPTQYQQTAVKEMDKGDSMDMRTVGGDSSEIVRSSDVILALWASTEDLMNKRMEIRSIPGRFNQAFEPIKLGIDLGVCSFISVEQDDD